MIRSFKLKCSLCDAEYQAGDTLYYRPNYMSNDLRDTEFICPACIAKWHAKWQIVKADFHDHDYVMTVDLTLADGSTYQGLDCTPYEEDQTVVVGEDIPVEAQKQLYELYHAWDMERKQNVLKYCTFNDEGLLMTVTCETYGGEKLEEMAFRFNRRGEMQTEKPIPDYLKAQIIDAYNMYEMQNDIENQMSEAKAHPSKE